MLFQTLWAVCLCERCYEVEFRRVLGAAGVKLEGNNVVLYNPLELYVSVLCTYSTLQHFIPAVPYPFVRLGKVVRTQMQKHTGGR